MGSWQCWFATILLTLFVRSVAAHEDLQKSSISASLLIERSTESSSKRSQPSSPAFTILGFITPWNAGGAEAARKLAERGKLDIVAPVEFQVTPAGVKGGQDFQATLYQSLEKSGAQCFPRFNFEGFQSSDFERLGRDAEAAKDLAHRIGDEVQARSGSGAVLEVWQSLQVQLARGSKESAFRLLDWLGTVLHDRELKTVLVLPPYESTTATRGGLAVNDFARLGKIFDHFVIMTYDFSGISAGPQAPISWFQKVATYFAKDCGLGAKVLMDLNFYGVDAPHSGSGSGSEPGRHLLGGDYIELLKKYEPDVVWLEAYAEHAFAYVNVEQSSGREERAAFYPTERYLSERIRTAQEAGAGGVGIWELGQGLPCLGNPL